MEWRVEAAASCGVESRGFRPACPGCHPVRCRNPAREAPPTPTPTPTPTPEQDNQLVKKFSEAKRTAEAERESQAQQVATAQAKLSKKESEVFGKGEEVNRQRAEQEEKEDEVRKGDPVWLTPG